MHSTASDGALAPAEVVARAAAAGVGTIALTDHDTLAGVPAALAAGAAHGVEVLPALELSIARPGGRLHLLAYLPAGDAEPLASAVDRLRAQREARAARILERLARQGVELSLDDVTRHAAGPIGRPHIAAAMVERGVVATLQEAFDRYLADELPATEPAGTLAAEEAIGLVRASGGAAVVAHPFTLRLTSERLRVELAGWHAAGLAGVEAYRPDHDAGRRELVLGLAAELGLVATGGSDFHRPGDGTAIGSVGDVALPDGVVAALRARC